MKEDPPTTDSAPEPVGSTCRPPEATQLRHLSAQQWKSGIAAWLGWMFDGLDMHLYVLVAAPFVAKPFAQRDLLAAIERELAQPDGAAASAGRPGAEEPI